MKKPRMFQTSPSTDKSDNEDGDMKMSNDNSSFDNWKGFVKNGNGHPVIGHQLSALLAQNGHNGGAAVSVCQSKIDPN